VVTFLNSFALVLTTRPGTADLEQAVATCLDSTTDSGALVQQARCSTEVRSLIAKLGLFRFDFLPIVDVCPSVPPARHNRHTRDKIRAGPPGTQVSFASPNPRPTPHLFV